LGEQQRQIVQRGKSVAETQFAGGMEVTSTDDVSQAKTL